MTPDSFPLFNARRVALCKGISRWAGVFIALGGATVLLGRMLDLGFFRQTLAPFKSISAFAFLLTGLSLAFTPEPFPLDSAIRGSRRWVALGCASAVLLIGAFTISAYLFGVDTRIDPRLFGGLQRMAPNASLNFLLIGLALLLLDLEWGRGLRPAQLLILVEGLVALLALIGHLYGVRPLYGIVPHAMMSGPSSLLFLLAFFGVLFARPTQGLMAVITREGTGSLTAIRLLPPALVFPALLGWLRWKGQEAGLYDTKFGLSLIALSTLIIFVALILFTAHRLNRLDLERRRVQEQTEAIQLHLVQAEKLAATGKLASGIAHEVKNPLAIILQAINFLEREPTLSEGKPKEAFRMMKESVLRADRILRGLFDFSRPISPVLRAHPIESVIDEALVLAQRQVGGDTARLKKEIAPDLPLALIDPDPMRQVFLNLILNAYQAMPGGGELVIRCALKRLDQPGHRIGNRVDDFFRAGETALVTQVEDTGSGIPKEVLGKVFDPFFTTKPPGQGTGLGLSVARAIVESHRGLISIESEEGRGTRVTVILPTARNSKEGGGDA